MNILEAKEKIIETSNKQLEQYFCLFFENKDILNESSMLLNESLTYYEFRQFLALLYKNARSKETKNLLTDFIKVITKLEIMNVPLPIVKKQKSKSPKIFN